MIFSLKKLTKKIFKPQCKKIKGETKSFSSRTKSKLKTFDGENENFIIVLNCSFTIPKEAPKKFYQMKGTKITSKTF